MGKFLASFTFYLNNVYLVMFFLQSIKKSSSTFLRDIEFGDCLRESVLFRNLNASSTSCFSKLFYSKQNMIGLSARKPTCYAGDLTR